MLLEIVVANGKFLGNFAFLNDGTYLIKLIPIQNKTVKEHREHYFSIIDDYCMHSGNNRYDIHAAFKNENALTTITKISLEEWPKVLESLKFWVMDKL